MSGLSMKFTVSASEWIEGVAQRLCEDTCSYTEKKNISDRLANLSKDCPKDYDRILCDIMGVVKVYPEWAEMPGEHYYSMKPVSGAGRVKGQKSYPTAATFDIFSKLLLHAPKDFHDTYTDFYASAILTALADNRFSDFVVTPEGRNFFQNRYAGQLKLIWGLCSPGPFATDSILRTLMCYRKQNGEASLKDPVAVALFERAGADLAALDQYTKNVFTVRGHLKTYSSTL